MCPSGARLPKDILSNITTWVIWEKISEKPITSHKLAKHKKYCLAEIGNQK